VKICSVHGCGASAVLAVLAAVLCGRVSPRLVWFCYCGDPLTVCTGVACGGSWWRAQDEEAGRRQQRQRIEMTVLYCIVQYCAGCAAHIRPAHAQPSGGNTRVFKVGGGEGHHCSAAIKGQTGNTESCITVRHSGSVQVQFLEGHNIVLWNGTCPTPWLGWLCFHRELCTHCLHVRAQVPLCTASPLNTA